MRLTPVLSAALVFALFTLMQAPVATAQTSACDDLSHIDFGACATPLGIGIVNGQCQSISGCSSPVPLFNSIQECEQTCPTCNDLSSIDFGDCLAVLGVGIINGNCEAISGCSSPVPLFANLTDCNALCASVSIEERSWGLIKRLYKNAE